MAHTEGTQYINFKPTNKWGDYLKDTLLIDEMYNETDIPIENLYSQIYRTTDSTEQKILKFKMINNIINAFLYLQHESPKDLILFKNDIQCVFVFKTFAIKIFRLDVILHQKLNELYELLLKNECPNLEYIYRAFQVPDHDIYIVVSKVVDTTNFKNVLSTNLEKYGNDIYKGLSYLCAHGWVHRDVSINNSGYDEKLNNYLLFDFNLSKLTSSSAELAEMSSNDRYSLDKSIKFSFDNKICS
jgi:tRNA A-37 threonylcarbamoyl transferase component Bud32